MLREVVINTHRQQETGNIGRFLSNLWGHLRHFFDRALVDRQDAD